MPREANYAYVRCHALPHSWDAVGPIAGRRPKRLSFGVMVTYRCEHCGALRFDVMARLSGELLYRFYEHPDDYKHEKMDKSHWRAAFMDEMSNQMITELDDGGT